MTVSSERMHTGAQSVAEGLTVLDVAPSREEIERRIAEVAAGRLRRPVLVLGIDGAYVPTRPDSARGRRPGEARHRAKRARWQGQWRDAKGFRLYLMDGERIVHVLSWHQVQNEDQLGEALKQVKEAGVIPEEPGAAVCRLRWRRVDMETCPGPVSPGPSGARLLPLCRNTSIGWPKAHYGASVQAAEWVEATLTRLYWARKSAVLGGLRRMQAQSDDSGQSDGQLLGLS